MPTAKSTWQTDYNRKEGSSSRRRSDALFSETRIFPAHTRNNPHSSKDENAELLESLIKVSTTIGVVSNMIQAIILTPEAQHDKDKTKLLLQIWGPNAVSESVQNLFDKKLLTRASSDRERIIPGRNYRISDKYPPIVGTSLTGNLDGV
jgi:hypothetical protein